MSPTIAPSEEATATLDTLPPELLAQIARATAWMHLRRDGTLALPPFALVCKAALAAARTGIASLRCANIRLVQADSGAKQQNWSKVLCRGSQAVLDVHGCDLPGAALTAWANEANVERRGLAMHKCHSIGSLAIAPALMHTPKLLALVCTSQRLGVAAMEAVSRLTDLRVLCLAESAIEGRSLHSCLACLGELRCCLLGGARILHASRPADGSSAIAAAIDSYEAAATATPDDATNADGAVAGCASCGPQLSVIETTFLPNAEIAALAAAAPAAALVDCCSPAPALAIGLARLRSALQDDGGAACEGLGCVAATALSAVLSARCDGFHETPLHHAAIEGDVEAVALLLEHGAPPDLKDAKGCAHVPVESHPRILRDSPPSESRGLRVRRFTPLARALFWGHAPVVHLLLDSGRCDIDVCNHAAESPTYLAALRGHAECLQLMLKADTTRASMPEASPEGGGERPPSSRAYHDGYTPLHAAVIARSADCIRMLLSHGFDPSAQVPAALPPIPHDRTRPSPSAAQSPLPVMSSHGRSPHVDYFAAQNRYGQSSLHIAARLGASPEIVQMLLASCCDVTLRDERGLTAAQVARTKGGCPVMISLLEAGGGSNRGPKETARAPGQGSSRGRARRRYRGRGRGGAGIAAGGTAAHTNPTELS